MKYEIPESLYDKFKKEIFPLRDYSNLITGYDHTKTSELMYAFKLFLKEEFEDRLKQTEHAITPNNREINIVDIHLMFDDRDLIDLLLDRGMAAGERNVSDRLEIEDEIKEVIQHHMEK